MDLEPPSGFEHRNPTAIIEDRLVPSFLVNMKILLILAKYSRKIQKQPPATLLKMRLWHRCFLVNFVKFLITPFSQNTFGRLFLKIEITKVLTAVFSPGQTWFYLAMGSLKPS